MRDMSVFDGGVRIRRIVWPYRFRVTPTKRSHNYTVVSVYYSSAVPLLLPLANELSA